MGSDPSMATPESEASVLQAFQQYLPTLIPSIAATTPGVAQQQLAATQGTAQGYNQLNLDQLKQFALPEAQVGQQVADSNAQAGAQTNLNQLNGAGGQAALAATALNRLANPSYYAAADAAGRGAAGGVDAISLTGLSPGEEAAVERSTNQSNVGTGNLGLNNASNVVANAMNFGGAFNNKLGLLNTATNTAANTANTLAGNGGVNATNVALGQPNSSTASNFGTGQFAGSNASTQSGSSGNAFNFAGGLLNSMNSANNAQIGANAQMGSSQISANSPAAYLGSVCCFIFLEAYYGKIPWYVRYGRDNYYNLNHDIATGYRRVAKWLVPLMQKFSLVRSLVWYMMVLPITTHLASVTGHRAAKRNRFITHSWLKVWALLGKGKCEQSYAMTWRYN